MVVHAMFQNSYANIDISVVRNLKECVLYNIYPKTAYTKIHWLF